MQVFIEPKTASTTYDFTIKDVDGNIISGELNCEGKHNELINIPVYSNIVLNIDNSSVDEEYKVIFTFRRS